MQAYQAPLLDYEFLLDEVFKIQRFDDLERFSHSDLITRKTILSEAARFCEEIVAPLNRRGDIQGCRYQDGQVEVPDGFEDAYHAFADAGWLALSADPTYGGQGLPEYLSLILIEMMNAANAGFYMYPGLITPACRALAAGGSEELKALYLPRLISGTWSATMNLTEPQCGTDLGLIRTQAEPQGDGRYIISGKKTWITSGEHEMTENIVHLVLARIKGAPDGIAGISLFLVPKFLPDAAGQVGPRNQLRCEGIEAKMGLHGSATCEMSYENATGWLIGEPNQGLKSMFVMMNEARLACGVQGLGLAEAAYQKALSFAYERRQGRVPSSSTNTEEVADLIIGYPSIQRMLLDQKSFIEGGRAFSIWLALQCDLADVAPDPLAQQTAHDLLSLLTPVAKAYLTDRGFQCISQALQIHGGAGYIEDTGLSQLLRDARITQIYEGTNAVQAIDLISRKVWAEDGRAMQAFLNLIDQEREALQGVERLKGFSEALSLMYGLIREALDQIERWGRNNRAELDAVAAEFLELMGIASLTLLWTQIARSAIDLESEDAGLAETKIKTGLYFVMTNQPRAKALLERLHHGARYTFPTPAY